LKIFKITYISRTGTKEAVDLAGDDVDEVIEKFKAARLGIAKDIELLKTIKITMEGKDNEVCSSHERKNTKRSLSKNRGDESN
jgi:hypothetical protein